MKPQRILGALLMLMIMATTKSSIRSNGSNDNMSIRNSILSIKPIPSAGPMPTEDPFLFCVYHKDHYPPATDVIAMTAPIPGNGQDFDPTKPYRMYHGVNGIPGFPQHPHRGFETITATMEGMIDHADSVGNGGRYGMGDVQWMTAGAGVVHSEMFPLIHVDRDNPLRLFQIWLNLPAQSKMVSPGFAMFWHETIPIWTSSDDNDDGDPKVTVTLWFGHASYLSSVQRLNRPADALSSTDARTAMSAAISSSSSSSAQFPNIPPPDSWAADPDHDVAIWHVQIQPGGRVTLPEARMSRGGDTFRRALYYVEGDLSQSGLLLMNGNEIKPRTIIHVHPDHDITLELPSNAAVGSEILLLQGQPMAEPVVQYGPFVMNTKAEIQQAFQDYKETEFGGWPWPRDDMVFDRNQGRFAKLHGIEYQPPSTTTSNQCVVQDDAC